MTLVSSALRVVVNKEATAPVLGAVRVVGRPESSGRMS